MVHFKEITKENIVKIVDLAVHDHQKDQVAPNAISIAVGHYFETAWFRGIYKDEEPVGFVMLELDFKEATYSVWRFMIDKNHQGKGYGKAAMELIKKVMKEKVPGISAFELSYVPKETGGADEFYRKLGFVDTGGMIGKEKIMQFKY